MKSVLFAILLALLLPCHAVSEDYDQFQKLKGEGEAVESELTPKEPQLIPKGVIVERIKREGRVDFSSKLILFDYGSWRLKEVSSRQLKEIAAAIKDPALAEIPFFFVDGHTCTIGSDLNNCILSWRRARSVVEFLVDQEGVPRNRIVDRGFGFHDPVASNDSEDGRQQNRRVVLKSGPTEANEDKSRLCR
jgi:outer membrane protein OmpA-like peptidoglycan-associated protein